MISYEAIYPYVAIAYLLLCIVIVVLGGADIKDAIKKVEEHRAQMEKEKNAKEA